MDTNYNSIVRFQMGWLVCMDRVPCFLSILTDQPKNCLFFFQLILELLYNFTVGQWRITPSQFYHPNSSFWKSMYFKACFSMLYTTHTYRSCLVSMVDSTEVHTLSTTQIRMFQCLAAIVSCTQVKPSTAIDLVTVGRRTSTTKQDMFWKRISYSFR